MAEIASAGVGLEDRVEGLELKTAGVAGGLLQLSQELALRHRCRGSGSVCASEAKIVTFDGRECPRHALAGRVGFHVILALHCGVIIISV